MSVLQLSLIFIKLSLEWLLKHSFIRKNIHIYYTNTSEIPELKIWYPIFFFCIEDIIPF